MSSYTRNGDRGTTELVRTKNVSKSDDRIGLIGTIEELTSYLGLLKTMISEAETLQMLDRIQRNLNIISSGVSDPYNKEGKLGTKATEELEQEICRLEDQFNYPIQEELPGQNRLSAEIDLCRSIARRAERSLAAVGVKFGADNGAKIYLNRLSDYLYTLARYTDAVEDKENSLSGITEKVVQEVLKAMGISGRVTLELAKNLIEELEEEAKRRGMAAVIAVCGPDGRPIAVHVMDGAFLVSFDVAVKKAYTAVAVKMSTMELNALAQPGGTFYGLDKMEGGNIIIFGGGVPLKVGDTIIGGLGVSGGTGEQDHSLAEYGLKILKKIMDV